MMAEDDTVMLGSFWDKLPILLGSKLHDALSIMPKPVVHHIHLTAACPISHLVEKICYYSYVYYN